MKIEKSDIKSVIFNAHPTMHRLQSSAHGIDLVEIELPSGARVPAVETVVGGKRTVWLGSTGIELAPRVGAAVARSESPDEDLGRPPYERMPPARVDSAPHEPEVEHAAAQPEDDGREASLPRPAYARPPAARRRPEKAG